MLSKPATYVKAIIATVIAFLGSLIGAATAEGGLGKVTGVEYLIAIVALCTAALGVFFVPNSGQSSSPAGNEKGHVDALLIVLVLIAFILGYLACKVGS